MNNEQVQVYLNLYRKFLAAGGLLLRDEEAKRWEEALDLAYYEIPQAVLTEHGTQIHTEARLITTETRGMVV